MLVIKINIVHIKPFETCFTALAHIFRGTVDFYMTHIGGHDNSEFRGYLNLFSRQLLQCLKSKKIVFLIVSDQDAS